MPNFSRHPYRTRANSKIMQEWGESQEHIKIHITQMKDQINQIMETLVSLKSTMVNHNEMAQSTQLAVRPKGNKVG